MSYEDGAEYVGEAVKGDKHGWGKYTLPSGSTYTGQFHEDEFSGFGTYVMRSDDDEVEVYQGEFKSGAFEGRGTYFYSDGAVYEGEWVDGLMHGHGRYWESQPYDDDTFSLKDTIAATTGLNTVPDIPQLPTEGAGDDYSGDFYEGEYEEDEKHGHGVYISADGARYEGPWVQGVMHGEGAVHIDSKSNRFEGPFCNNQMHGRGKMVTKEQQVDPETGKVEWFVTEVEGTWENGQRVHEETGEVLHAATDPNSNLKTAQKAAALHEQAEREKAAAANFRHKDSRVRELPDEF